MIFADPRMVGTLEREIQRMVFGKKPTHPRTWDCYDPRMVGTLEREQTTDGVWEQSRYTLEREIVADPRMVGTLEREQSRMVFGNKADTPKNVRSLLIHGCWAP